LTALVVIAVLQACALERLPAVKCAVDGRAATTTVGLHIERRRFVEEVEYRAVHPEVLA
jgi:hypothetical protein